MKTHYAILLVVLAAFAVVLSHKAIAEGAVIPLPTGQFSATAQGSVAICLSPTPPHARQSCSTAGALVVRLSLLDNGTVTLDNKGNACSTFTEVDSDLPVDASPPIVTPNVHVVTVAKGLKYDSTTGTGDNSFTGYIGGACHGATFDSTGATKVSSGTYHFVVTNEGKRIDSLITKFTNSTNSAGDFSLSATELKQ